MNGVLNNINKNQVLQYLGYKGGEIDVETEEKINTSIALCMEIAQPRIVYKVFSLEKGEALSLEGTNIKLLGEDIKELLKESKKVVLFAATIGNLFETYLRKTQITDMSVAVILDSCGSSAIENICDNFQSAMEKEWKQKALFLTDRFSPGYGDMPLEQQKEICSVLDTSRKAGITITSGDLLVPTKSVVAIMGISKNRQEKRSRGCQCCKNFANCALRREGRTCD